MGDGDAYLVIPKKTLSANGIANIAALTIKMRTIASNAAAANADLTIPMRDLSARGAQGIANLTIPMKELFAFSGAQGVANLTIPIKKITANGYTETVDTAILTIPMRTLSAFSARAITLNIPMKTLIASGRDIYIGRANLVIPIRTLSISGWQSTSGNAYLTIPMKNLLASGASETKGSASLIIPMRVVSATEKGTIYRCVVINLYTGAITEYTNFNFDNLAGLSNSIYASKDTGIYLLGGDDDAGTNINATVQPFRSSFGTPNLKNISSCLLGLKTNGKMKVTPLYEDYEGTPQIIVGVPNKLLMRRAKFGLGKEGQFVGVKIENIAGEDFDLDSETLDLNIKRRRINE